MADGVIVFRTAARAQDATGVWRDAGTTDREVFCRVDSVTRGEFFGAGKLGLKPEYKFTVFPDEYHSEDTCIYEGTAYVIYRTYSVPGKDELELYARLETGVTVDGRKDGA